MSVQKVRKLFIFILIFLPLQYIFVGMVGHFKTEPWPAFIFPGFKNVYETKSLYKIHQTQFELYNSSDKKIASFSPHLFFSGIPRSQVAGLSRSLFRNKEEIESFSPEAKAFLLENGKRLSNHEVGKLDIIYRKDFLRAEADNFKIDSVDSRILGTIQAEF